MVNMTIIIITNFKFDSTASLAPSLRLIMPDKNPHIIAVEPEDGMVTCLNGYLMLGAICVKINTIACFFKHVSKNPYSGKFCEDLIWQFGKFFEIRQI